MSKKKDGPTPEPLRRVEHPTAAYPVGTLGGAEPRITRPVEGRAPPEVAEDPAQGSEAEEPEAFDGPESPDPEPHPSDIEHERDLDEDVEDELDDTGETTQWPFFPPLDGDVHPAFLVLSLLGGGLVALAVVAVIGVLLLLG